MSTCKERGANREILLILENKLIVTRGEVGGGMGELEAGDEGVHLL